MEHPGKTKTPILALRNLSPLLPAHQSVVKCLSQLTAEQSVFWSLLSSFWCWKSPAFGGKLYKMPRKSGISNGIWMWSWRPCYNFPTLAQLAKQAPTGTDQDQCQEDSRGFLDVFGAKACWMKGVRNLKIGPLQERDPWVCWTPMYWSESNTADLVCPLSFPRPYVAPAVMIHNIESAQNLCSWTPFSSAISRLCGRNLDRQQSNTWWKNMRRRDSLRWALRKVQFSDSSRIKWIPFWGHRIDLQW